MGDDTLRLLRKPAPKGSKINGHTWGWRPWASPAMLMITTYTAVASTTGVFHWPNCEEPGRAPPGAWLKHSRSVYNLHIDTQRTEKAPKIHVPKTVEPPPILTWLGGLGMLGSHERRWHVAGFRMSTQAVFGDDAPFVTKRGILLFPVCLTGCPQCIGRL